MAITESDRTEQNITANSSPSPAVQSGDQHPKTSLRALLPLLAQHKVPIIVAVVLSILASAAALVQPLIVNDVLQRVENGTSLGLIPWLLLGVILFSAILVGVQHYVLQRTGEGLVLTTRKDLVRHMLRLPMREFDHRRSGDLVSRVGSDTTELRNVLTQGLIETGGTALLLLGSLIAMLIIDPLLFGITAAVVVVALLAVILLSTRMRVASREAQESVGEVAANVLRSIRAIRTIRASNATEAETATIYGNARSAWRNGLQMAKIQSLIAPISGITTQVSFLVVLGVGGLRVVQGEITVADLVTFVLFLFMIVSPLASFINTISSVNRALGALSQINEIFGIPQEDEVDPTSISRPTTATGRIVSEQKNAAIQFDSVSFRYGQRQPAGSITDEPRDNPLVLDTLSFSIPYGRKTALVGPSGAGKSTIFALIERFYDPISGSVRVGGQDIRNLDRFTLRSQIGYVEQEAPILAGSFRDNLLLAAKGATDEECFDILDRVNLSDVVGHAEGGLDTPVGENGVMLSGGERQRLAIARVLLAAQQIMILDESTSNLDANNEQFLKNAIDAASVDRTLLVIAHRLSTVVDSDQIIVLDQGQVVGAGTHEELLSSTPLYAELASKQLLN